MPNAVTDLKGRTALVTGAGRRLGRALSLAIAGDGADVVLHYNTSKDDAKTLRDEIKSMGRRAWAVRQNLTGPETAVELMEKARDAAGGIDILINNASVYPGTFEKSLERENIEDTMMMNAWVPWILSMQFSKNVEKGDIINLLDARIAGHDVGRPVYYLSKQALRYITEELALNLAPHFRVNAIAPGLILPPQGKDRAYFDSLMKHVPLKRGGESNDVAHAALFLLHNRFITGHVIFVDGGEHLLHRMYGSSARGSE